MSVSSRLLRWSPAVLSLALAGSALAQDDPELGETGRGAQTPEEAPAKKETPDAWGVSAEESGSASSKPTSSEWESAGGNASERKPSAGSDHEAVVGKIGFGLLGLAEVPVGTQSGSTQTIANSLTAPVIGTRYWFGDRAGFEAGLGFMIRGGSVDDSTGNKGGDVKARAFALHGGLPISIAYGAHYNVLAIPYIGLGFGKATDGRGDAASANDVYGKGFLFEAGLRAGVELQLGAIGLEGFALQLTAGLRLRYEKRTANIPILDNNPATPPSYDQHTKAWVFETSPGSSLGSAVTGCLAALYYF
jgi:hypothetical protein